MTGYNNSSVSKYTRLGYYLTVLAVIIQGYLWIAHFQDTDAYGQNFAYIAGVECLFALSGLLLYDPINKRGFHIKPKNFTPLSGFLIIRVGVILAGLAVIQFTVQFIPMTVKDPEIALSIVFAGPSEENFFRGVLVSSVIVFFSNVGFKIKIFKKELSIWVLFGIILTSLFFGAIHVNYYSDFPLLLGTILCGIWLGLSYWFTEDLTAVILAHFALNFIFIFMNFWVINF